MKKSTLVLLLSASFGVATVAVAQNAMTPATEQNRTSQPTPIESIEAVETVVIRSTVVAIDTMNRTITVQTTDGAQHDVVFGNDRKSFDTIKLGDQFAGRLTRTVMIDPDSAVGNAIGTVNHSVERTITGGTGGINTTVGQTLAFNTTVQRINLANHTVTFVNPDGSARTVEVTNSRLQARLGNLTQGQNIRVRLNSTFQIVDIGRAQ